MSGAFFKDADAPLIEDLAARGLLFKKLDYVHQYPHCWRCHTALIYYALPAWYIRTTRIKERLLELNAETMWFPASVKTGRFGDWLENNVDWSLSRSRYWGTPLPIWRNDTTGALVAIGSLRELGERAGQDLSKLDPHRPFIDEVTFTLEGEEGRYWRVPDVIDAWYDSGAMPFAQWGYPYAAGSVERLQTAYPAQFICEAIDQTRGWFYSLMAVGTLAFGRSSYENVVCLGHILAEDGRKMSKHLGNVLLPLPLMESHTADAIRWFMACSGSPWSARLLGEDVLNEIVRKVLLTYWNIVAFQVLYASTAQWAPGEESPAVADRPALDRWITGETQRLVRDVTKSLDEFDTQRAGALISGFIDVLSNWYVRRSRRRFWRGDSAALATLHETLRMLTLLLAPLTPFITERVWQDLFRRTSPDGPDSVHLARWPVAVEALIDEHLSAQVELARRIVELGRAGRADAKVKTRQPLRRAVVPTRAFDQLDEELRKDVAEELNVIVLESFAYAGEVSRSPRGATSVSSAKGTARTLPRSRPPSRPRMRRHWLRRLTVATQSCRWTGVGVPHNCRRHHLRTAGQRLVRSQ